MTQKSKLQLAAELLKKKGKRLQALHDAYYEAENQSVFDPATGMIRLKNRSGVIISEGEIIIGKKKRSKDMTDKEYKEWDELFGPPKKNKRVIASFEDLAKELQDINPNIKADDLKTLALASGLSENKYNDVMLELAINNVIEELTDLDEVTKNALTNGSGYVKDEWSF